MPFLLLSTERSMILKVLQRNLRSSPHRRYWLMDGSSQCGAQIRVQLFSKCCTSFGTEKNHDSQRPDRILLFFLHAEVGQLSPHFGAISLLNYTVNLEKRGENPLENIQKKNSRQKFPEIADFCPLSWSNVS